MFRREGSSSFLPNLPSRDVIGRREFGLNFSADRFLEDIEIYDDFTGTSISRPIRVVIREGGRGRGKIRAKSSLKGGKDEGGHRAKGRKGGE